MKNKPNRIFMIAGCSIMLLVILVPLIAGVFILFKAKGLSQNFQNNPANILVTISDPGNGTHYPVNGAIPILTQVTSEDESIQTMELWAGSNLINTYAVAEIQQHKLKYRWEWVPPTEGEYVLQARARSKTGQIGLSNLVRVIANAPQTFGLQIYAKTNDTIASIAKHYQVKPEDIRSGTKISDDNAGVTGSPAPDINAPLQAGEPVIVPVSVQPPTSDPLWSPSTNMSNSTPRVVEAIDSKQPIQQIKDRFNGLFGGKNELPAAPELVVNIQDCDINLLINDTANNEAGFFVYRSNGQSSMERIALLEANTGNQVLQFTDKKQTGEVTYFVSTYNNAGETPGNPASASLGATCDQLEPSQDGLTFDSISNVLTLPKSTDLAYVYLKRNNGEWHRSPYNVKEFFQPNGSQIDLKQAIEYLPYVPGDNAGRDVISIEAWGWQGESIIYLGSLEAIIYGFESSYLRVCGDVCSSNDDNWLDDIRKYSPDDQKPWIFRFRSLNPLLYDSSPVSSVYLQISPMPIHSSSTLVQGMITLEENYGSLETDIYFDPRDPQKYGNLVDGSNQRLLLLPGMTYYVRAIPMSYGQAVGEPSNPIQININPYDDSPPPIYLEVPKDMPAAYNVKIIEFDPIHDPEPGVCKERLIVEEDYTLVSPEINGIKPPDIFYPKGTYLCPEVYRGTIKTTWELIWEGFVDALSTISQIWETIKQTAVDAVGGVVCNGDSTCKAVLMAGLNAGLMALGIPPTIPNLNTLLDEGIGMIAAEVATELTNTEFAKDIIKTAMDSGLINNESEAKKWLGEQIASGIRAGIDEIAGSPTAENPGCESKEAANNRGVEPICLPGLKARLDPAGQYSPPILKLEISRSKTEGINMTPKELEAYWITTSITATDNGYNRDHNITSILPPPTNGLFHYNDILKGTLLSSPSFQAPYLDPGESTTISLVPQKSEYWAPGHQEALNGWSTQDCRDGQCFDISTDDWWKLYYYSTVTIDATVQADCTTENYQYSWGYNPANAVCKTTSDQCIAEPMPDSLQPFKVFCK